VQNIAIALSHSNKPDEALSLIDRYLSYSSDRDFIYALIWINVGNAKEATKYIRNIKDIEVFLILVSLLQASDQFNIAFNIVIALADVSSQFSSMERMLNIAISNNCKKEIAQLGNWFAEVLEKAKFQDLRIHILLCLIEAKSFLNDREQIDSYQDELRDKIQNINDVNSRLYLRAFYLNLLRSLNKQVESEETIQNLVNDAKAADIGTLINTVSILNVKGLTNAYEVLFDILTLPLTAL
jgi:hypothetical protein